MCIWNGPHEQTWHFTLVVTTKQSLADARDKLGAEQVLHLIGNLWSIEFARSAPTRTAAVLSAYDSLRAAAIDCGIEKITMGRLCS